MKKALVGSALGLVALGAHAQSSVTLYGIVDTGIGYQNSSTTLSPTITARHRHDRPRAAARKSR